MKKTIFILFALVFAPALLLADAGILIPRDKAQPDPAILSLEEMEITVHIDNGDARVFVRQIFANHTGKIEEGKLHLRAAAARPRSRILQSGMGPRAFQRSCSNASGPRTSTLSSSNRPSIPGCCRWANEVRKKPNAVRCSARASSPFSHMEPSAWRSNITKPFRSRA